MRVDNFPISIYRKIPEFSRLIRPEGVGAQEVVCRALNREWLALRPLFTTEAKIVQRGYVDLSQLLAALERARDGRERDVFSLIRIISLEIWLRGLNARTYSNCLTKSLSA